MLRSARDGPGARTGVALVEMVVALAVSGVTLAAFAVVVAQHERAYAELSRRVRSRAQSSEGIAVLSAEFRALSPAAGDIPPGGARDSSIELRSPVGSFVVCARTGRTLSAALASFVTPPEPGDTAWAYVADDTAAAWVPLAVGAVTARPRAGPAECPFAANASSFAEGRNRSRVSYELSIVDSVPPAISLGDPIRLTRRVRYSLYRAPDGRWYLGRREWSAALSRFETIQPVSGPYRAYAVGIGSASGLELLYFDPAGAPIESGSAATGSISRIAIVVRAPAGGAGVSERRDVSSVTIAPRDPR